MINLTATLIFTKEVADKWGSKTVEDYKNAQVVKILQVTQFKGDCPKAIVLTEEGKLLEVSLSRLSDVREVSETIGYMTMDCGGR